MRGTRPRVPAGELGAFIEGTRRLPRADAVVETVSSYFTPEASKPDPLVVRALSACLMGATPDQVSGFLGWRDFERFCALILRARGFEVLENIVLTNPRAQIDLVARTTSSALIIDCKHWSKVMGPSALLRAVSAQEERAVLLRARMPSVEPMLIVIVSLSDGGARFAGNGAVVPLRTLPDFVSNLALYAGELPRF